MDDTPWVEYGHSTSRPAYARVCPDTVMRGVRVYVGARASDGLACLSIAEVDDLIRRLQHARVAASGEGTWSGPRD